MANFTASSTISGNGTATAAMKARAIMSSTIHGQGLANAALMAIASTTTTITGYLGDDAADYVPGFDLTPPPTNGTYSFVDPDLLAAVDSTDVVGRFEGVQEVLWASEDSNASALLIALRSREQGRVLAAGKNYYNGSGNKALALLEMRMLLSS